MTRGRADFVLVSGAMNVNEAVARIRILLVQSVEPQNTRRDQILRRRKRFVYIHGTKHEDKVGTAASHGCVRMRNEDVIELFGMVDEGTPVVIEA